MSIRIHRHTALISASVPIKIGDTLSFVEDGEFLQEARECGLTEEDLEYIQTVITACPCGGEIVPVTQHIRDMFYRIDDDTVVIRYVFFEAASTVLLLAAYLGEDVLPMTSAEASEVELYIARDRAFFTTRHTR